METDIVLWTVLLKSGGDALEHIAQRSCGCPIPGGVQGQVGWGLRLPGLVLNVEVGSPACGRGCWSLVNLEVPSNPSHSVIL